MSLQRRLDAIEASATLSASESDHKYIDAMRREAEASAQLAVGRERLEIAQKRAADAEQFLAEGLIAEPQLNERLDIAASLQQSVLQTEAQLSDAIAAQSRARLQKQQAAAASERDLADVDQRMQQIRFQMERTSAETVHVVRAPIDGKVTALQARIGEQSINGVPLGIVLPEFSTLIAEINLPSRAIGFVQPGQLVKLQYDAFPYQKFGIAYGEISKVASTAQMPQEIGISSQTGEPLCRVTIELEAQSVEAYSKRSPLQAGMELTADIVLEDRRLLEWLLEPLKSKS